MGAKSQQILVCYPFLNFVVDLAKKHINPEQIVLYGSRARGDHTETSDFDIAFRFGKGSSNRWAAFCSEIEENVPTLAKIELLDISKAPQHIQKAIELEGVVLYERQNHQ